MTSIALPSGKCYSLEQPLCNIAQPKRLYSFITQMPCFHSDLVTNARIDLKDRPLVRHLDYIKYDLKQNGFIRFRELWSLQAKLNNETISSSQALEIIKLFNFCGDEAPPSDLLSSIWKTLKSKNVPLNVDHYNAYLQVHVTNNLPFPVHAYWNEMKKKGFQLNL